MICFREENWRGEGRGILFNRGRLEGGEEGGIIYWSLQDSRQFKNEHPPPNIP